MIHQSRVNDGLIFLCCLHLSLPLLPLSELLCSYRDPDTPSSPGYYRLKPRRYVTSTEVTVAAYTQSPTLVVVSQIHSTTGGATRTTDRYTEYLSFLCGASTVSNRLTAVGKSSPSPVYPVHLSRERNASVADPELVAKLCS